MECGLTLLLPIELLPDCLRCNAAESELNRMEVRSSDCIHGAHRHRHDWPIRAAALFLCFATSLG